MPRKEDPSLEKDQKRCKKESNLLQQNCKAGHISGRGSTNTRANPRVDNPPRRNTHTYHKSSLGFPLFRFTFRVHAHKGNVKDRARRG